MTDYKKITYPILLLTGLAGFSACGRQIVEFPADETDSDTDSDSDSDSDTDTDTDSDSDTDMPPTVISTLPLDGADDILVEVHPLAEFSEAMDVSTINGLTFRLDQGPTTVQGVVTYDVPSRIASFAPEVELEPGLIYTASVSTGVTDKGGLAMVDPKIWSFTTAGTAIAPFVVSTDPEDEEEDVLLSAMPTATFSRAMDPATLDDLSFIVTQEGDDVPGTVTYDALTLTATFDPNVDLELELEYTATITTDAMSLSGINLATDHVWTFTAGTAPLVLATTPQPDATGVDVNATPTASFSLGMDPATINEASFTLFQGLNDVPGTVTLDQTTDIARFTPDVELTPGLTYTATITTDAYDLLGFALEENHFWSFTTIDLPKVVDTTPLNLAIDVAVDARPSATFNTAMNPLSVNNSSFTVSLNGEPVIGTVTLDETTDIAYFTPTALLMPGLTYIATVSDNVEDVGGQNLGFDYVWTFTVNNEPTVLNTNPTNGAEDVSVAVKPLATFSTAMDGLTIDDTTFILEEGVNEIDGVVTYNAVTHVGTFTPTLPLESDTTYTATLTTGVEDIDGNALEDDYVWTFSTAPAPSVTNILPGDTSTEVSVNKNVEATFNTEMNPLTVTAASFTVSQGVNDVLGVVTLDDTQKIATFDPTLPLEAGKIYTVVLTTANENIDGAGLADEYSWSFTTGACSQATVELGSAANFAGLAGSELTNTGLTEITGDLGVSPGTAITGFPPGILTGTQHSANGTALAAKVDLLAAYLDAKARTLCSSTPAVDLGGTTLTPGLYTSATTFEITAGDLTLDANGDSDAVFIFQTVDSLQIAANKSVFLTKGALAANVFWQVGTSATLLTDSVLVGTVMADQSVTFITGAELEGRAHAVNAALTLDDNLIELPVD